MKLFKLFGLFWDIIPNSVKIYFLLIIRLFINLPLSITQHLHFNGAFTTSFKGNKVVVYSMPTQIENRIFWHGFAQAYEPMSLCVWAFLTEETKDGNVIDIGANSGIFSLISHSVNKHCQIHAFEPLQEYVYTLKKIKKLNKMNMIVNDTALGEYNGLINIDGWTITKNSQIGRKVKVQKLSDYWINANLSEKTCIKIDIEGFESTVLREIKHLLIKYQPSIVIEILTENEAQELASIINDIPYLFYIIDEGNKICKQIYKIEYSNRINGRNILILNQNLEDKFKKTFNILAN